MQPKESSIHRGKLRGVNRSFHRKSADLGVGLQFIHKHLNDVLILFHQMFEKSIAERFRENWALGCTFPPKYTNLWKGPTKHLRHGHLRDPKVRKSNSEIDGDREDYEERSFPFPPIDYQVCQKIGQTVFYNKFSVIGESGVNLTEVFQYHRIN